MGADVTIKQLRFGDYIIDSKVTIERKTGRDFLISILDGRLFRQVAKLKKNTITPLLIVEGSPFKSEFQFHQKAIMGALVSIQAVWYLPVLCSRSIVETIDYFEMISRQYQRQVDVLQQRKGYRPSRLMNRQLFLLQGLPNVGPKIAKRLLMRFGSIVGVVNASMEELATVVGIGKLSAEKIRQLLDTEVFMKSHTDYTSANLPA